MSALPAILDRVLAATGPDRALDRAIMSAFYKWGWRYLGVQQSGPAGWRRARSYVWIEPETKQWKTSDRDGFEFTASVDRTLALSARLLGTTEAECLAQEAFGSTRFFAGHPLSVAFSHALLVALLRRLIANNDAWGRP